MSHQGRIDDTVLGSYIKIMCSLLARVVLVFHKEQRFLFLSHSVKKGNFKIKMFELRTVLASWLTTVLKLKQSVHDLDVIRSN